MTIDVLPAIWLNDSLVPAEQARVSPLDHGITVGNGAFETIALQRGSTHAQTRHLRRLQRSAAALHLPVPDLDHLNRACRAVAEQAVDIPFARLRVTWTAGHGPLGSAAPAGPCTLIVAAGAIDEPAATAHVVTSRYVRNERGALTGVKSTSYADNVIGQHEARQHGASEALMANTVGNVCEGTSCNVFMSMDARTWLTPPLASGCLGGITRELLLEWAAEHAGPRIVEQDVAIAQLPEAKAIALTSCLRDVQVVSHLDGQALPETQFAAQLSAFFAEHRHGERQDP